MWVDSFKRQTSPRCCHLENWTKHASPLILAIRAALCEKMTSSTKPDGHNIALLSEEDWAMATGNMYRKFGEICRVVSEICELKHRQTDIKTRWLQKSPTCRDEVKIKGALHLIKILQNFFKGKSIKS